MVWAAPCPSADRREKPYHYTIPTKVTTTTEVYTFATPSGDKGCSCMYYYIYYKTYNIRYIHGSGTFQMRIILICVPLGRPLANV